MRYAPWFGDCWRRTGNLGEAAEWIRQELTLGSTMLHEFLTLHRDELIERCRSKAVLRFAPASAHAAVVPNGVPILDQLIEALRADHVTTMRRNIRICGRSDSSKARQPRVDEAASQHGLELSRNGFPVSDIVYGYGDLCQAVMDLAVEHNATIRTAHDKPEFICPH